MSLASWLAAGDADLIAALAFVTDDDASTTAALVDALKPETRLVSHPLAKQVYWLAGTEPQDDDAYHLLQPLVSSTLESVIYPAISGAKNAYFEARGTQKKTPTYADHATYPDTVRRNIGGANPQNVSPLNSVRHGDNYLLTSLPPPAWKPRDGLNLRGSETVFGDQRSVFLYFGEVRTLIRELADFLKTDPEPNKPTRDRVDTCLQGIAQQLATFGIEAFSRQPAGWTRDEACRLPLCEQLWLDADRTELPQRNDPEHLHWQESDLAFNAAYARGDWADEVAERFARWLSHQLGRHSDKLKLLGETEMRHFASLAILDVAWPIPLQRRAKAGAA